MAMAKWYGEWVMDYRVHASNGNRWVDHAIVKADTFEEALQKVEKFCTLSSNEKQTYIARGTGYKLMCGGGCRW